ncbi:glutathione hydrolase 7-like isoform X2 [Diorhabda sublineata]|uniref:glutathione hydrolase 7-like isoform X2 n=1 Tax=Diorhabda sublineata TaxID=1163346 RepID=UPI0024E06F50|nr:glutathione hydrolase 7-like isoform X2 [Diorhabda sublineata]
MSDTVVTREDIPLKKGKVNKKWYSCGEDDWISGSKYVNVAFGTLTVIITVALIIQIYYGDYQVVPHGSVASDSLECSKIGTSVLKNEGNSIDAAIATAFCLNVATPHLTSLDAEGQILIYNHRKKNPPVVITFSHNIVESKHLPTSVLGLAYIHKKFGFLPWRDLIYPAVNLARNGILIPKQLVQAVAQTKNYDVFGPLEAGQLLVQSDLATTLEHIANMSESVLHSYLEELNETALIETVIATKFMNFDIYVPQTDATVGQFLVDALNIFQTMNLSETVFSDPVYAHELVDVVQYYQHKSENSTYRMFHEGTISNIAVMDTDDNYVSLVTGLYQLFGSGERTHLGYIEDIYSNKMSSRMPVLITDSRYVCERRYVFGVNNLGSALQIISNLLLHKENVTEAIEAPRLYIGNWTVGFEGSHLPSFPEEIFEHSPWKSNLVPEPYQSINIVVKYKDELSSHSDSRGGGIASRF